MHVLEEADPHHVSDTAGIVPVALVLSQRIQETLVCRVSMQNTGRPAFASPSNSHCDNGPASTPTLSKLNTGSLRQQGPLGERPLEKLQHHNDQLPELKKSGHILTDFEKFQMASMEHEYRSIYNSLCNERHNNLRALTSRHFRKNKDGSLDMVIFDTSSREDLAATLDTSNRVMHHYFMSASEVSEN
nr:hypothetical protein RFYW14_04286 [Pseudorhizobium flavum]